MRWARDHAVELGGDLLGLALGFEVAGFKLRALVLEALHVRGRRAKRLALRQQEVAGVALLDVHDLAHLAEFRDAFEKYDFHLSGSLLHGVGQEGDEAGALDRAGKLTLLL